MTTLLFVAAIAAIANAVALPPERDTLLVAALEHPLVANATREGRLGWVRPVPWSHQAVLFVALVSTVGVAVTPPCLEDAVAVVALELPVLTAFHLVAVFFVAVVRTVLIPVAVPGHGEASPSGFTLKLSPVRPRIALGGRGCAVALITPILAILLQIAFPLGIDALPVLTTELLVAARCLRTILLVALVTTVIVEVTLPVAWNALSIGTLELVVFAFFLALFVVLICVVPTVRDSVTEPRLSNAEAVATLPLILGALAVR